VTPNASGLRLNQTLRQAAGKQGGTPIKERDMLVLSRKPGEKILIGDKVQITIVRIGPNTVRLGIDAPRDMNIVREELCVGEGTQEIEIELPEECVGARPALPR